MKGKETIKEEALKLLERLKEHDDEIEKLRAELDRINLFKSIIAEVASKSMSPREARAKLNEAGLSANLFFKYNLDRMHVRNSYPYLHEI